MEARYLSKKEFADDRRNFGQDLRTKADRASKFQKLGNKIASAETQERNQERRKDPNAWRFNSEKMRKITKFILQHQVIEDVLDDLVTMSEEDIVRKYTEYTDRRLLMLVLLCSGTGTSIFSYYIQGCIFLIGSGELVSAPFF